MCEPSLTFVCCCTVVDIAPGVEPSCTGQGAGLYRTFDRVQFLFNGQCRYTLFSDGHRLVSVRPVDCERYSNCKKVTTKVL